MKDNAIYSVVVSNVGVIHTGDSLQKAKREYWDAKQEAVKASGRASGESVTLMEGEAIIMEFKPDLARVELTDTFAGEANYGWVRRYAFNADGMSEDKIKRAAKACANYAGVRGTWEGNTTSGLTFRPRGECVVLFVSFDR